jgi:diguanylate cyclase (GGDEF)-like protein
MQQASAFEILDAMHADRLLRHVPVIAVAEHDDRENRLRALTLGAVDCLVKPVDAADLALRLRNALATKRHLDRLASTDDLTGLPNRETSLHRLDWAIRFSRRHDRRGAVLQVGLDRFKKINDAVGPAMGDELLRGIGQRLLHCLRDTDSVTLDSTLDADAQLSRGDGDEFTVLLPLIAREEHAGVVARRIVESIAASFTLDGREFFVTCRVGIAVFPADAPDADGVLHQAKLAMRSARAAGAAASSGVQFFSSNLNGQLVHRLAVERDLHHALERDELVLHYQPKVDLASGRIVGAEALLRWQHPQRGLLGAGDFIDVAEESGLILPIGNWVLREALRQVALWRHSGLPPLLMNVNVSSLQFRQPGLKRSVQDALLESGVDGSSLCLELTESVFMTDVARATSSLRSIRELGVRLALDDFGTGFSSLSYLRRFPIDELKIDRSFIVQYADGDKTTAVIVQAIVAMARGLDLSVVGEGIETEQQLDLMRACHCDQYQGYLFSKPVPAGEFEAVLQRAGQGAHSMPGDRLR